MRPVGVGVVLALLALAAPAAAVPARPTAGGAVIRTWNDLALDAVRLKSASDAVAARSYAMINVAMYDAVNGLTPASSRRTPALVPPGRGIGGDPVVAAAGAARDVLVSLYPDLAPRFDGQLAADLAGAADPDLAERGRLWGGHVAGEVVAARQDDGSAPTETLAGGTGPGVFPDPWKGTQFRQLRPFVISDPGAYVSDGPPSLASAEYAAAFNEVKQVGSKAVADPAADATFAIWRLGAGTSQPPGAWIQVAETVSEARSLPLADTARLFALESMALADTVAPTYSTKYLYHSWRPTTAVRQADPALNPATTPDASWTARAGSPGTSPEHFSGHSTFSAAGATVLAGFFCRDDIPFTMATDSAPGHQARTYPSFSAAAAEAGRSRVLGGLHFEFSNHSALIAGQGVGTEVLATSLLRMRGGTHNGDCP